MKSPPLPLQRVVGEEFAGSVVAGKHARVGVAGGACDESVGDAVFGGFGDEPGSKRVAGVVGGVVEQDAFNVLLYQIRHRVALLR